MALYRLFYGRVSSKDQNLDLQLAQAKEMNFDQVFAEHITGRRSDRPKFLAMMEAALSLRQQGHQVECWVVEWSRWARNTIYSLEKVKELEAAGVVIMELTTRQPVSLSTASGLITTATKSLMAEYYSAELSERLQRSLVQRRKINKFIGAAPPFGYQRSADKTRLEPSPDWKLARETVERFLAGESINKITGWLYQSHGIQKSRSGIWCWLRSPTIRGHIVYGGSDYRYNQHPALVTEAEFRQIEYQINLNRQLRGKNWTATIYAVPTFVHCGECGRKANTNVKKAQGDRYFCCRYAICRTDCTNRTAVNDKVIEAAIQEAIVEAADRIAIEMAQPPDLDPVIAALEAERATLEPLAHRPAIAEEIAAIDAEIANKKAGVQSQDASHVQTLVRELAQLSSDDWEAIAMETRRAIYSELCHRVTILGREVIEVRLR